MNRVFIIDDDEMYQLVLQRTIKKVNPDVQITSYWNGDLALESFRNIFRNNEPLPKIVFLDINMPVLDGWQFLSELDKINPGLETKLTIYMISSSLDTNDKNNALNNKNITDFLIKPISVETLQSLFPKN